MEQPAPTQTGPNEQDSSIDTTLPPQSINPEPVDTTPDNIVQPQNPTVPDEEQAPLASLAGEEEVTPPDQYAILTNRNVPQIQTFNGALVYTIPIVIPKGRNGIEPSIALTYNSQVLHNNSIVGSGWEIPIPSIKRMNKSGAQALFSTNTFYSSLDGELVFESGTTYRPASDTGSYRKYTFSSGNWTVTEKDGATYKFGSATSSRQDDPTNSSHVYAWLLDEIRDTNSNYAKYTYYKDSGAIYPSTITYTGNNVTDGIFSLNFGRESRPDIATTSEAGFSIVTRYRINEIRADISGSWVTKYTLAYGTGDNSAVSLLTSVTHSGRDVNGTITSYPPNTFSYSTSTPGWTLDTNWSNPVAYSNRTEVTDVNGDALADVLYVYPGTANEVWLNNGSGWTHDMSWSNPAPFDDNKTRLADVNGDGLTDVLRVNAGVENKVWINNGGGWTLDTSWSNPARFDDNKTMLADVNGDGLIDVLRADPGIEDKVWLNNGSGWTLDTSWSNPVAYSNRTQVVDVNGDALADVLYVYPGVADEVWLNNGGGWTHDTSWSNIARFDDNKTRLTDVNGDGLIDVLRVDPGVEDKVWLNNGTGWTLDTNWSNAAPFNDNKTRLADVNGDGLTDVLRVNPGVEDKVHTDNGPRADLLTQITHPEGGSVSIEYTQTPLYRYNNLLLNPNLPTALDTVSTVTENDGKGHESIEQYQYDGADYYFNTSFDRQFAGFATTTVTDPLGNVTKTYYHQGNGSQTTLGEYQDHVSKIGKPYRTEEYNASGNLYRTTVNRWDRYAINATSSFVKLATTTTLTYDGDSDHKDTAVSYTYDNTYGNVSTTTEYGEVTASTDGTFSDTGSDKRTTDTTYIASTTPYIVGLPKQETVKNQSGTTIADTKYYYDTLALGAVNKGNLTKTENWVSGSTWVNNQKAYNSYGLVASETDPRGKTTSYTYDSYNLYPATTTNPLGHTVYQQYDYSSGKVATTTDPNGLRYATVYDGLDRPLIEKQPDTTSPSTLVTKTTYEYTDTKAETKVKRSDSLDATSTVDTYQYFDGLGRLVQTRAEAENANTFVARDRVYNERGELKYESLPYFSTGSASTSATTNSKLLTTYAYDVLGRPASIATAVGTTSYAYDQWTTTVTDANGHIKDLTHDAYDRLASVGEHNGASTYTTTYGYDPLNNLTSITDALSNVRAFTYDGLSRRTKAEDLHASGDSTFGRYLYAFDAAGNVSSSTNPNGQAVNYTYDDINRPLTEDYLGQSGTEVTYGYDSCAYGKGKLCTATSSGAVTSYTYDALTRTATETKKVATTTYATGYRYDRQGNMTNVVYPDRSEVVYEYDGSGRVETIRRKEATDPGYSTLSRYLTYTPIDTLEYYEYGDTSYTYSDYDPDEVYRLRYRASIARDTGTSGSGMPTYLGGDADAAVPAQLARMRATVPGVLQTNTATKTRYMPRTHDSTDVSPLPTGSVTYDPAAALRTVSPDEQAFYESGRKAHPVQRYVPTSHRTAPGKSFELDTTSATRDVQPDGSVVYLLSTMNPPRASQRLRTEGLWLTNTITENRSFESNLSYWDYWASTGSTISRDCTTAGSGTCSLKAYSSTSGNEWDTAALQELRIEPDVTYKLTFKAKAAATSSFYMLVGQNYSPWLDYGLSRAVTVTPTWQTYTYTFRSAASSSDERADVYFGFGAHQGTFYVDDVRLIPDELTVVRNPSFENGTINEWYFGGPGASYSVPCTGAPDGVCALQASLTQAGSYWTVEFSHDGLSVASSSSYNLSFDAKAGASRNLYIELGQAHSPWNLLAPTVIAPLTNSWTHYTVTLTAQATDANARIGFYMGNSTTSVSIDNVRFREAVPTKVTDMTPEFSGIYDDPDVPDSATSYQIQVDYDYGDFSSPLYDSGKTAMASTSEGTRIADKSYAGPSLDPDGTRYKWRMKLWDESNNEGAYTNGEDYFYTAGDQVQQVVYAYDRVGNITQILDDNSVGTDKNYVYQYDDLNRLATTSLADDYPTYVNGRLTADAPVSTIESYGYNAIGNITSKSDLGSYTYAGTNYANPHAVTSVNGQTYTYDNNGNVTADGVRTNTWNYANRLTQTTKSGTTYRYTYDHSGDRTAYYDGSATTTYPNKYYDQKGSTVTKHLYLADGTLIGSIDGTSTNAVLRYVYTDHLGGTKGVTKDGGARSQMLDYYPFGATRINAQYESANESKKFTGHEYDDGTALYYMQARYQNPSTGKFMSQDPVFVKTPEKYLEDPQQANSYGYARNNPLRLIDPTGNAVADYQPLLPTGDDYISGERIGTYHGIDIRSRGPDTKSDESPYQCVDFVNTYLYYTTRYGLGGTGNANDYAYQFAVNAAFTANHPNDPGRFAIYPNGGSIMPNENDYISWSGGNWGHVGIVADVVFDEINNSGTVYTVEQNFGYTNGLFPQTLTRSYKSDGTAVYTVGNRDNHMTVQAWGRYENQSVMTESANNKYSRYSPLFREAIYSKN